MLYNVLLHERNVEVQDNFIRQSLFKTQLHFLEFFYYIPYSLHAFYIRYNLNVFNQFQDNITKTQLIVTLLIGNE